MSKGVERSRGWGAQTKSVCCGLLSSYYEEVVNQDDSEM